MAAVCGPRDRLDPGERRQAVVVARHQLGAVGVEALEAVELGQGGRGLQVGQVGLEAGLDDVVVAEGVRPRPLPRVAGDAVRPQQPQPLGRGGGRRRDDPALAAGEALGRVEREAREVADRAHAASAHVGLDRVGGVLDGAQTVLGGDRAQRVHVARAAGEVHGHQGAGAARDRPPRGLGIEVERTRVDVGEDRRRARVEDRVDRRRPGERARHHLVAGADVGGDERQVQRLGARRRRDRIRHPGALREALLELGGARPRREPAGAQGGHDRLHLLVPDHGRGEVEHGLAHGPAAVDREPGLGRAAHRTSNRTASTASAARRSARARSGPVASTYPARSVAIRSGP